MRLFISFIWPLGRFFYLHYSIFLSAGKDRTKRMLPCWTYLYTRIHKDVQIASAAMVVSLSLHTIGCQLMCSPHSGLSFSPSKRKEQYPQQGRPESLKSRSSVSLKVHIQYRNSSSLSIFKVERTHHFFEGPYSIS